MAPDMQAMMGPILAMGSGAGFKNVTEGMKKMAESGGDMQSLMAMPNAPLFMTGAGLKDIANSMELLGPLMKMMQPPAPPEQPDPNHVNAAMQMLTARMGPGMSGVSLPPPAPQGMPQGMPMGPGMGGGMPPRPMM